VTAVRVPDPARVRAALEEVQGRRAVVVGAGRSGLAAARLLAQRGARVEIEDDRPAAALVEHATELEPAGIVVRGGGIDAERLGAADLIVVSPGVPLLRPELREAAQRGALLIGEIDVALAHTTLPLVAITGTNGKSTTTTMVGSLLAAGGAAPFVGGNLGQPLCEAVTDLDSYQSLVVELSSYQLELASLLRPRVAVITNLSPDHLDRYPDAEAYYSAKRRIFAAPAQNGCVVARQRDLDAGLLQPSDGVRWLSYGRGLTGEGAAIEDAAIIARLDDDQARFEIDNPRIRGEHNRENLAAAILTARAFGIASDRIRQVILDYRGIAHRLEAIATVDEVLYVNDSKGTNVDATEKALASFDAPVLLIAGGRDKGTGYGPLIEAARGRVRVLLTIGEAAPLIAAALGAQVDEVVAADTLDRAVQEAAARARSGEVVLLSPACASFDQFANFEERGHAFATAVRALGGEQR